MNKENKQEIPQEVLIGLFRIMCGVPSSFPDSAEVYDNAKQGMRDAYEWVLEWGENNNINNRGNE